MQAQQRQGLPRGRPAPREVRSFSGVLHHTGCRRPEVIEAAGIPEGPHASPKGHRHCFGVHAVSNRILQKWLGHAQLSTTAIYANAIGQEEQSIAARMWS